MLFHQGDYSNSELKKWFKEQIEVLEENNGGVLFRNSPGATAREITILGLDAKTDGDVEKAQISTRVKYLENAFLLILDRRQYGELILSLKNNYAKHQRNYPIILTDMYRLLVALNPTRATLVAGGRNKGLNFGNVVADSEITEDGDHGGGGGIARNLECWNCGGEHLKRNRPNRAEEREKTKKMAVTPTINALM